MMANLSSKGANCQEHQSLRNTDFYLSLYSSLITVQQDDSLTQVLKKAKNQQEELRDSFQVKKLQSSSPSLDYCIALISREVTPLVLSFFFFLKIHYILKSIQFFWSILYCEFSLRSQAATLSQWKCLEHEEYFIRVKSASSIIIPETCFSLPINSANVDTRIYRQHYCFLLHILPH